MTVRKRVLAFLSALAQDERYQERMKAVSAAQRGQVRMTAEARRSRAETRRRALTVIAPSETGVDKLGAHYER